MEWKSIAKNPVTRLLVSGSALTAGVLAGALTPENAATTTVFTSALFQILGNIGVEVFGSAFDEKFINNTPRDEILKNGDLTRAVGLTIFTIFGEASNEEIYGNDRDRLKAISESSTDIWEEIVLHIETKENPRFVLTDEEIEELSVNKLTQYFRAKENDIDNLTALSPREWERIIDTLAEKNGLLLESNTLKHLSEKLYKNFSKALRKVLVNDFAHNGKAFASMQLRLFGESLTYAIETNQIVKEVKQDTSEILRIVNVLMNANGAENQSLNSNDLLQIKELLEKVSHNSPFIPKLIPADFLKVPPYFTGRKVVLDDIAKSLKDNRKASLCGIKGLGKTSVVYKFIHDNQDIYQHVIFIRADRLGFLVNFEAVCREMLLDFGEGDTEQSKIRKFGNKIQELCGKLEAGKFVLLIFDNVDEVKQVAKFVPNFSGVHLLLTSNFIEIHDIGHRVSIDNLTDEEADLLLDRKAKNQFVENLNHLPDNEQISIRGIAKLLGNHAFALSIAGIYIRNKQKTFEQYLNRLQNSQGKILRDTSGADAYDHESIYNAFEIPFEEIWQNVGESENEKALAEISHECLKIASLLAADKMPEEVFIEATKLIHPNHADFISDEDNWDNVYEKLARYGFIERNPHLQTFSVHLLFKLFLQDRLKLEAEAILELYSKVLADNFEFFNFSNKEKVERYLSHVGVFLEFLETYKLASQKLKLENEATAKLCNGYARYFQQYGQYGKAQKYYELCKDVCESIPDIDQNLLASTYNNLALLYRQQGKYDLAEKYYLKALAIFEKELGVNHPSTATTYNNLAGLFRQQEKYDLAEKYYLKALAIREKELGVNHPSTATTYNNLAGLYHKKGNLDLAKEYQQKSLNIRVTNFGENHPDVAHSYWWIGTFCQEDGKFKEALENYNKAKQIYLKFLPKEHPNVQSLQGFLDECEVLAKGI